MSLEPKPSAATIEGWIKDAESAKLLKDYKLAAELYQKAADARSPCGQFHLGSMYELGRGTTKSINNAKYWYQKAEAQNGNCSGVAKVALERLAKTATAPKVSKSAPSPETVAGWVQKGDEARSSGDYVQAFELYGKAADVGDQCGQYRLGVMHENGLSSASTASSAVFWYKKAVLQNGKCSAQSQCNLALLIATGKGTIKNPTTAAHWTFKSLQNGNEYCIKNMTESATVREIQKILKQRGLYNGAIDGSNGPNTQAAMRKLLP